MPRFVILEHDWPVRHWDLLLESGSILKAWRLTVPPISEAPLAAEASFDHRLIYLDFEGEVPGNRGRVLQWDHGTFTWLTQSADQLQAELRGQRLFGMMTLRQTGDSKWVLQMSRPAVEEFERPND